MIAIQPIPPALIGAKLAPQIIRRLVLRVLEIVFSVGTGLPDVKDGARDGPLRDHVGDGAVHEDDAAGGRGVLDDGAAVGAEGCGGGPKGAKNRGGCGIDGAVGDDFVCDFVDEAGCECLG